MYTVDVYVGRRLTDAEIASLGPQYTPAVNGHLYGKLRVAASSARMARVGALDVMGHIGVEAVVDVPRQYTWAGPVDA